MSNDNSFPNMKGEWLVPFDSMMTDQGMYNGGKHFYVDIDKIVDDVDEVLYDITHPQEGI